MATAKSTTIVSITPPKIEAVKVKLVGTAPLMMARFSEKARDAMMQKMSGGQKGGTKKAREARDYQAEFEAAKHVSTEGWNGIPCSGLRAARISSCRLVNYTMTRAKLSLFVEAEGFDRVDSQPLFRLYGEPERNEAPVRNASGVFDVRVRPLWREWYAEPVIRYDADQFSLEDVLNLLSRVGLQVGLMEGRPDSRNSAGLGFGTFTVHPVAEEKA